ncbi:MULTISPECIES: CarD family transcriptional regulator [Paenibacillus]|uniref:CarD family transcriptional regulator n=1 Tax=Paenibacillus TaxID=44249 RepID=UPI00203DF51E|nr:CarD family transcriptional regulator [Paenibacillus camelliae]MCM3633885.1 CarD family transcriptional regulator [Paenibacillus camelliae]
MFEHGDYVVYGSSGVCQVDAIGKPDIPVADESKSYYKLLPVHGTEVIYCPVDTKVFMRPIIPREEAVQLIQAIGQDDMPSLDTKKVHAHQFYESLLNTHDCRDLVQLIKVIYSKNNVTSELRKMGGTDQKYLKTAEDLLFTELSVALGASKDDVKKEVEAALYTMIA